MSNIFAEEMRKAADRNLVRGTLTRDHINILHEMTSMLEHMPPPVLERHPMVRRCALLFAAEFFKDSKNRIAAVRSVIQADGEYLSTEFLYEMNALRDYISYALKAQNMTESADIPPAVLHAIRYVSREYGNDLKMLEELRSWIKTLADCTDQNGQLSLDGMFGDNFQPLITADWNLQDRRNDAQMEILPLIYIHFACAHIPIDHQTLEELHADAFGSDFSEHIENFHNVMITPVIEALEHLIGIKMPPDKIDQRIALVGGWIKLLMDEYADAIDITKTITSQWFRTLRIKMPDLEEVVDGGQRLHELRDHIRSDHILDHWNDWVVDTAKTEITILMHYLHGRVDAATDRYGKVADDHGLRVLKDVCNRIDDALSYNDPDERATRISRLTMLPDNIQAAMRRITLFDARAKAVRSEKLPGILAQLKRLVPDVKPFDKEAIINALNDLGEEAVEGGDMLEMTWGLIRFKDLMNALEDAFGHTDAAKIRAALKLLELPDNIKKPLSQIADNDEIIAEIIEEGVRKYFDRANGELQGISSESMDSLNPFFGALDSRISAAVKLDFAKVFDLTNAVVEECRALIKIAGIATDPERKHELSLLGIDEETAKYMRIVLISSTESAQQFVDTFKCFIKNCDDMHDIVYGNVTEALTNTIHKEISQLGRSGDQDGLADLIRKLETVQNASNADFATAVEQNLPASTEKAVSCKTILAKIGRKDKVWGNIYEETHKMATGWQLFHADIIPYLVALYRAVDCSVFLDGNDSIYVAGDVLKYASSNERTGGLAELVADNTAFINALNQNSKARRLLLNELKILSAYTQSLISKIKAVDFLSTSVSKIADYTIEFAEEEVFYASEGWDGIGGFTVSSEAGGHAITAISVLMDWMSRMANFRSTEHDLLRFTYLQCRSLEYYAAHKKLAKISKETRNCVDPSNNKQWILLSNVHESRLTARYLRFSLRRAIEYGTDFASQISSKTTKKQILPGMIQTAINNAVDEVRDIAKRAPYHREWPSQMARNHAEGTTDPGLADDCQLIKTELITLKTKWNEGEKKFNKAVGLSIDALTKFQTLKAVMFLLRDSEPYPASFIIERLSEMIDVLENPSAHSSASPGFLTSHILDFKLLNAAGIPELSSLEYSNMVLELINRSDSSIILDKAIVSPADPAEKNSQIDSIACHFILRFRRGTLLTDLENIGLDGPSDDWDIVGRRSMPMDKPVYDELLIRGPKDHEIGIGQSRHLVLTQIKGMAMGTRSTRVLLLHQALKGPDQVGLVPGDREKRLVVAHRRVEDTEAVALLPIKVGFKSSNTVLNTGTDENTLTIELTNVARRTDQQRIRFWNIGHRRPQDGDRKTPQQFWRRSKIILTIETMNQTDKEESDWAVCTMAQAVGISTALTRRKPRNGATLKSWQGRFLNQGVRAEWVFTPPLKTGSQDLYLDNGEALTLEISHLITSLCDGPGKIHIKFENFPDYPDRAFELEVQKGPVLVRDGKVGIRTAKLDQELNVGGDVMITGAVTSKSISVKKNADISGNLEIDGMVTALGVTYATLPAGVIMPYAGKTQPLGWLRCDGNPIPHNTRYAKLRKLLNSDNTPNLVGRTIIGAGSMSDYREKNLVSNGVDPKIPSYSFALGKKGGSWVHELGQEEMPRHQHFGWGESYTGWPLGNQNNTKHKGSSGGQDGDNFFYGTTWAGGKTTAGNKNTDGKAHSNVQPYHAFYYIIKY